MEIYKPFWNIYRLVERVKKNKEQCPHVLQRLQALEKLAIFMEQEDVHQIPQGVKEALVKLNTVLVIAEDLIKRFTDANPVNHMMKATDFREEFDSLNKSLTDAFVTLSSALHIYQGQKLDEQEIMLTTQERRLANLKDRMEEQEDTLERVQSKLAGEMRGFYCVLQ